MCSVEVSISLFRNKLVCSQSKQDEWVLGIHL